MSGLNSKFNAANKRAKSTPPAAPLPVGLVTVVVEPMDVPVTAGRWVKSKRPFEAEKMSWVEGAYTLVEMSTAMEQVTIEDDNSPREVSTSSSSAVPPLLPVSCPTGRLTGDGCGTVVGGGGNSASAAATQKPVSCPTGRLTGDCATAADVEEPPKRDTIVTLPGNPEHPLAKCSTCGTIDNWRKMRGERIRVTVQMNMGDPEDTYFFKKTCIPCCAKENGRSLEETEAEVLSRPIAHKKARYQQLNDAKALNKDKYKTMDGMSRSQIRMIDKQAMVDLFSPLAKHALRKMKALEKCKVDGIEHDRLTKLLHGCADIASEHEILMKLEALEVDNHYIAFADQANQHEFILAASFSDIWTEICNPDGTLLGRTASWYICGAKTGWDDAAGVAAPCLRMTPSKDWRRKLDDPLTKGRQKYYCKCYAGYNHSWGQVVELSRWNRTEGRMDRSYLRSDVPPWDVEDIRAAELEERLMPTTARELFEKTKRLVPTANDVIIENADKTMKLVDNDTWMAMPHFSWKEVFNMTELK
jgi:hypothetical protein